MIKKISIFEYEYIITDDSIKNELKFDFLSFIRKASGFHFLENFPAGPPDEGGPLLTPGVLPE